MGKEKSEFRDLIKIGIVALILIIVGLIIISI